jgi:hypothetical protein
MRNDAMFPSVVRCLHCDCQSRRVVPSDAEGDEAHREDYCMFIAKMYTNQQLNTDVFFDIGNRNAQYVCEIEVRSLSCTQVFTLSHREHACAQRLRLPQACGCGIHVACATRLRLCQAFSRTLVSQKQ